MKKLIQLTNFIFDYSCDDYLDAYIEALRILGEKPKDNWTEQDCIETIFRAIKKENKKLS